MSFTVGVPDTIEVTITVNVAPVANAGSNATVFESDLVTLDGRLLSEQSKEDISDISDLPIDPEGRTKKNVLKMMLEDGFIEMIPGNEDGYINYLKPYMNLIKSEKKVAL